MPNWLQLLLWLAFFGTLEKLKPSDSKGYRWYYGGTGGLLSYVFQAQLYSVGNARALVSLAYLGRPESTSVRLGRAWVVPRSCLGQAQIHALCCERMPCPFPVALECVEVERKNFSIFTTSLVDLVRSVRGHITIALYSYLYEFL